MTKYQVSDWTVQLAESNKSNWKEFIYCFMRPVFDKIFRKYLSRKALSIYKPELVLGTRGFPLGRRRKWGIGKNNSLAGKTVLVQGTGNGWDLADWAKYGPRKLIGVDLFEFESWSEIKKNLESRYRIEVEFHASPLDELSFISNASIDFCASDAVFEHIQDIDKFLRETFRVLKSGGLCYAGYGPLWYSAGGDHFSGRGGIENVYNHIILDKNSYLDYFTKMKMADENFQSGGRYVEIDLFSKLKTNEYLEAFSRAGFKLDSLIIEISEDALVFKRKFPRFWEALIINRKIEVDDLIIRGNFVRLIRP